jgi:hypothetical protein
VRELHCPDRDRTFYRVLVGHIARLEEVDDFERMLRTRGFPDAFAIAAD